MDKNTVLFNVFGSIQKHMSACIFYFFNLMKG
jgi:hypothetical protein